VRFAKPLAVGFSVLLGIALLLTAGYFAVGERVEVVIVRTTLADGTHQLTRLWVVDYQGDAWLRGTAGRAWLEQIRANPYVEVNRGGGFLPFLAVPIDDPAVRDRINALTLEKYGWSESVLRSLTMNPEETIPVHLDPR
jgi:hypothetical protein